MNPTWIMHNVCDGQTITYHTHGLNKYNSLEIELNLQLVQKQAALFLNLIADNIAKGAKYHSGQYVEGIFNTGFYVIETKAIHNDKENQPVLRVIIPDPNFKFPWEDGCNQEYKKQLSASEINTMIKLLKPCTTVEGTTSALPFVQMEATIILNVNSDEHKDTSFNIGGFEFVVNSKNIQFDFDASSHKIIPLNEHSCKIIYSSGQGLLFDEYTLNSDYFESWKKSGIDAKSLTSKHLASTTKIIEFYLEPFDEDVEIASIELQSINFYDELGKKHKVSQNAINDFNKENM